MAAQNKKNQENQPHKTMKTNKKLELCALVPSACVYTGRRTGGRRCQLVGMEDNRHPGKLRKYECCPVSTGKTKSSSSSKKSKLVKGLAFIGDEDDSDSDDYVPDDDILDDDDDDDDDHPHDDPSNPDPDQHDHTISPPPQHAQSYDYVSDDEFVNDAGIHKHTLCIRHNPYLILSTPSSKSIKSCLFLFCVLNKFNF